MIGLIIGLILVVYAYAQEEVAIQPNIEYAQEPFIIPEAPLPPAPVEPIIISEEEVIQPAPVVEITTPVVQYTPTPEKNSSSNQNETSVNIGLSSEVRQKVASILNKLLSDEFVLYTKTLKFHWNVQGIVFHDFHQAFKEQYEKLFDFVDLIAERARALGAPALGSLQDFSTYTRLKEANSKQLSALEMVKELLADHEAIIRTMRQDIEETGKLGDQGTSNFLQDLIVKHEKIAWMLRATAQ
jgi:starvation-inducible DNA-binding protein